MKIGQLDTKKIVITDFETYFDDEYTLRKLRTEEYIADSRFKAHGVAVTYHTGKSAWIEAKDIPKWLKGYKKHTIVNHNMYFDGLIWKMRYNHVAPFMVDTRLMANQVYGPADISGGNDLESLAERLGLQPKGRVDMFKGVRDLSPELRQAIAVYATNDSDITFRAMGVMLPLLTRPEFELWLMDHTLRIYIDKPLPVIEAKAKSGIVKVQAQLKERLNALPTIKFNYGYDKVRSKKGIKYKERQTVTKTVDESVLASNTQFGQAIRQTLAKQKVTMPMKMGKKGMIPALAKADEGFIALKSSKNKIVRDLVIARLTKRSGDTQIARLRTLLKIAAVGGFRPYLNYWGAHTGRWSGGSGLNPQNFPNPGRSTDDFEREIAELIRATISPGKGMKFAVGDAANIEARILAWWAGQQDLVDAFGDGTDVYSTFASETFGEEVRKPTADDSKEFSSRLKLLRNAGKEAVLGLGYGMGNTPQPGGQYGKLELRMRARPDIAPLFVSGELNKEKCDAIIKQYRGKYTKIVALWDKAEAAFFAARDGSSRMVNGVLFSPGRKNGSVKITLPSGRELNYPRVRVGEHAGPRGKKQWVFGHGKGRKVYGGLLVENVVQAISRDILAESIWAMEHEGYPVAYHIHDSIAVRVKAKVAKKALAFLLESLSTAPEWGTGMKLGAEGSIEEVFA